MKVENVEQPDFGHANPNPTGAENFNPPKISATLEVFLTLVYEALRRKWDYVSVVDGEEGTGKSELTKNTLGEYWHYLTGTPYTKDNVVFTPTEFIEACKTLPQYSIIIWDEAIFGATGRDAISKMGIALRQMFSTIRKRNLFIVMIMPRFTELAPYLGKERTRALLRVKGDLLERGKLDLYLKDSKRKLYQYESREIVQWEAIPDYKEISFHAFETYGRQPLISEEEYEQKKDDAISSINDNKKDKGSEVTEDTQFRGVKIGDICHVAEQALKLLYIFGDSEKFVPYSARELCRRADMKNNKLQNFSNNYQIGGSEDTFRELRFREVGLSVREK